MKIDQLAIYRHRKSGGLYKVITFNAKLEATEGRVVVYQNMPTGVIWVRDYDEFVDGRFEIVTAARQEPDQTTPEGFEEVMVNAVRVVSEAAAAREREECAKIAEAIDSGRGNEKEIAIGIRARNYL